MTTPAGLPRTDGRCSPPTHGLEATVLATTAPRGGVLDDSPVPLDGRACWVVCPEHPPSHHRMPLRSRWLLHPSR
jgi:hypothetical protein